MLSEHDVPIAPSTYYAHRARGLVSQSDWDDAHLANRLFDLWRANRGLYGAEKLWTAAQDADICQVPLGSPRGRSRDLPADGHEISPVAAISSGGQARGITPRPVVAWARRMLSPVVVTEGT